MTTIPWEISIVELGVIPNLPLDAYLPSAPAGALISPPSFAYLLSDRERVVVVDTGSDLERCAAAGFEIIGDAAALLAFGLAARDVDPGEVDLVVHTHLHYDHMGNDLMFPAAPVAVQRTELEWATQSLDRGPFYVGVEELVAALDDRLRPLDGEVELYPGLSAIASGGHTPGHQSLLVQTAAGPVCICGDVVSLAGNTEEIGSVCPDADEAAAFLARARAGGWELLPSHDPGMRAHRFYLDATEARR